MDKEKLEALKSELPTLRVVAGDTVYSAGDKLMRLAEIQIELALAAIELRNG